MNKSRLRPISDKQEEIREGVAELAADNTRDTMTWWCWQQYLKRADQILSYLHSQIKDDK